MPTTPKPRARKRRARPAADSTCSRSRTVIRGALVLTVWSCSSPRVGEPGAPRHLRLASVVKKIGGRSWRFFHVSRDEASGDGARYAGPGHYFEALDDRAGWMPASAIGPYSTLIRAVEDARFGIAVGVW